MATIKQLEDGSWEFRVRYYSGGKQKEIRRRGLKKREAVKQANEMENKVLKGYDLQGGNVEFGPYMRDWYETFRKGEHSAYNDEEIERSVRFAENNFSGVKLRDLTRKEYQQAINQYASGHSTASVRKIHMYMKACLQDAIQDGVIYKDPTYRIKTKGRIKPKDEQLKFLNLADTEKLSRYILKDLKWRYISRHMILFALATGCRFSEVSGMTWDCIDLDNKTVRVDKKWDWHNTHTFGPTKTASSKRLITIDDETAKWLEHLKVEQSAQKAKLKEDPNPNNLVFVDKTYHLVSDNAVNKTLRLLADKLSIKKVTFHALRHTHASIQLYSGRSISWLSKRLGHASIMTTYKVYIHIIDELFTRENEESNETMSTIFKLDAKQKVVNIR
ncbi:site-specific integrase [Sporolactobacillus sp. CQH2019]|uniref:tyrosine-type recombinase/integrase n=1 Tax=Sporolactobacillus sp. CQH2019 TaxID=3023512 RepID=UPI0023678322|nr:site-specific integrase [Sporolactobacillus sp. CQH2019]MDD9148125.1 site-specific integrase [Sporolactobacillus sp. CQH2019]